MARPEQGWEGRGEAKARVGVGRTKPGRRQGRSEGRGGGQDGKLRASRGQDGKDGTGKGARRKGRRETGVGVGRTERDQSRQAGRRVETGACRTSPMLAMSRAGRAAAAGATAPGPPAWLARDAQSRRVRGSTETRGRGRAALYFRRPPIRTSAIPRASPARPPCWVRRAAKDPVGLGRARASWHLLSEVMSRSSALYTPLSSHTGPLLPAQHSPDSRPLHLPVPVPAMFRNHLSESRSLTPLQKIASPPPHPRKHTPNLTNNLILCYFSP